MSADAQTTGVDAIEERDVTDRKGVANPKL